MRSWLVLVLLLPAVASAGYRVSSFKTETKLGADYWNAAAAIDGKLDTCWRVDAESENVNEWIEIDVPRSTIDKIAAVAGWEQTPETRTDYARIKSAKVEVFDGAGGAEKKVLEQTLTFEDKAGWQVLDVADIAVGDEIHGGRVRVTVAEVFDGADYPQLAVSEVLVHLAEKDAPTAFRDPPASAAGKGPELMLDANPKTFWLAAAAGPQSFLISANGWGNSAVGIQAGPKTSARPKTVEINAGSQTSTAVLEDKPEMQWVPIPGIVGYTGSSWGSVEVKVLDTYEGTSDPALGITEMKLRATNFGG